MGFLPSWRFSSSCPQAIPEGKRRLKKRGVSWETSGHPHSDARTSAPYPDAVGRRAAVARDAQSSLHWGTPTEEAISIGRCKSL